MTVREGQGLPHRQAPSIDKDDARYRELIGKEAKHWGEVVHDPQNPQIWHDEQLFEMFFGKKYRHLTDRVVASGPRVLELGCGEGNLTLELARHNLHVDAIDLSEERIARAKSRLRGERNVRFMVGDLNVTSLEPATYDCIVAHDSLHHILHLDHLLSEVSRALKPAGVFVVMDFVGMGRVRRLLAALATAVLPTYQPYSKKLKLARRLKAFLASETQKRKALVAGQANALHEESPFEEISQESIVKLIHNRFRVVEEVSFNPFWYYLAPKVRLPQILRHRVARIFSIMDDVMIQTRVARGAYVFIEARKV
jgi:ubiquinone/menaquinone biosynthesis C-methylase UbiE